MPISAQALNTWSPGQPPKALKDANVVLIFGPDEGGVYALAQDLLKDEPSPTRMNAGDVTTQGLLNLLNTADLFGPTAPVLVTDAKDAQREAFEAVMNANPQAKLVVLAGDLKKTSKMVKLFDEHAVCAQIYTMDPRASLTWMNNSLKRQGFELEREAAKTIAPLLPGNRMEITRLSEVLTLSALGHGTKAITQDDVQSIVVDFSDIDAGGALDSALNGNIAQSLQRFDRQLAQGENPIKLFRLWAYRLGRLNALAQTGLAPKAAVGKARPPVFWKDKPFFEKALSKLGTHGAAKLIEALDTAERNSVEKRQPPRLVAEKFLYLAATQKAI
mgnify:CR=1 FL=1